jgi:hypothetical protein
VSFRDISTIIKIERRTGRIVWKLGAPPLSGQYAPTLLPNGNHVFRVYRYTEDEIAKARASI